jgi:hypothetical protein
MMQEYKFEPDVEITAGVDTRDANLPPIDLENAVLG